MPRNGLINRVFASFLIMLLTLSALSVFTLSAQAKYSPHLRFAKSRTHPDVLVMLWNGPIRKPMSEEIRTAFDDNKASVKSVELKLNSGGGSVKEGEHVIAVLQGIKKTHKLYTAVAAGKKCGSMCVFIYVQGQPRLAAPASLWLFHEVSIKDSKTHKVTQLDRARWEQLVDKYWVPAGVDLNWIRKVKSHTVQTDYWQSGESLLRDHSNIITRALSDDHHRVIASPR